jgi:hypothetical protein
MIIKFRVLWRPRKGRAKETRLLGQQCRELFKAYFRRFLSLESTQGGTKAAACDSLCRAISLTKEDEVTN